MPTPKLQYRWYLDILCLSESWELDTAVWQLLNTVAVCCLVILFLRYFSFVSFSFKHCVGVSLVCGIPAHSFRLVRMLACYWLSSELTHTHMHTLSCIRVFVRLWAAAVVWLSIQLRFNVIVCFRARAGLFVWPRTVFTFMTSAEIIAFSF